MAFNRYRAIFDNTTSVPSAYKKSINILLLCNLSNDGINSFEKGDDKHSESDEMENIVYAWLEHGHEISIFGAIVIDVYMGEM